MPKKPPLADRTGPMGVQPLEHGPTVATQMLPMMPCAKEENGVETQGESKAPRPEIKKARTRTDAVRAALARITRRKSLRKQRDAQKA
jgi:hypothetical protein